MQKYHLASQEDIIRVPTQNLTPRQDLLILILGLKCISQAYLAATMYARFLIIIAQRQLLFLAKKRCKHLFISCSVLGGMSGTDSFNHSRLLSMQVAALSYIHDAGYEYVEVFQGAQPLWFSKTIACAVTELCLKPYSIHLPKSLVTMNTSSFEDMCHGVFSFASDTGVEVIVAHPPDMPLQNPSEWQSRLGNLLNLAEDTSCTVTLEIIPNATSQASDCIRQYHDRCIGVTIDIEHMFVMGMKTSDMIEMFGEKILDIHVRDSDGNLRRADGTRNYLSLGKGDVDFRSFFNQLRKNGYCKALTVELGPANFHGEIVIARDFMKDCLESIRIATAEVK